MLKHYKRANRHVIAAKPSSMPRAPKVGKRTSWKYGNGTYTGVVTRVTKDYVYARTTKGLEKKIPRKNK